MKRSVNKEFIITEIKKFQLCLMEAHMGDTEVDIKEEVIKEMIWDLEQVKQQIMSEEDIIRDKSILEGFLLYQ